MLPMSSLEETVVALRTAPDAYISQASFVSSSRKVSCLQTLRAAFVDLDCYQFGIEPNQEFVADVVDAAVAAGLPEPSYIVFSGRGVNVKWLFNAPIEAHQLHRWQALQLTLQHVFKGFAADAMAKDPARVFRILGTTNSKSGNRVGVLRQENFVDFNLLCHRASLIDIPKARSEANRKIMERAAASHKAAIEGRILGDLRALDRVAEQRNPIMLKNMSAQSLNWSRFLDLRDLAMARGGIPEGSRDLTMFWMMNCLSHAEVVDPKDFRRCVYELLPAMTNTVDAQSGNRHFDPANDKTLNTLHAKLMAQRAGKRVKFNGVEYAPLYTPTNDYLIELFQISAAEQEKLKTLIGDQEKLRRADQKVPGRQERRQARLERNTQVLHLLSQGHGVTEVAQQLHMHKSQVSRIKNSQPAPTQSVEVGLPAQAVVGSGLALGSDAVREPALGSRVHKFPLTKREGPALGCLPAPESSSVGNPDPDGLFGASSTSRGVHENFSRANEAKDSGITSQAQPVKLKPPRRKEEKARQAADVILPSSSAPLVSDFARFLAGLDDAQAKQALHHWYEQEKLQTLLEQEQQAAWAKAEQERILLSTLVRIESIRQKINGAMPNRLAPLDENPIQDNMIDTTNSSANAAPDAGRASEEVDPKPQGGSQSKIDKKKALLSRALAAKSSKSREEGGPPEAANASRSKKARAVDAESDQSPGRLSVSKKAAISAESLIDQVNDAGVHGVEFDLSGDRPTPIAQGLEPENKSERWQDAPPWQEMSLTEPATRIVERSQPDVSHVSRGAFDEETSEMNMAQPHASAIDRTAQGATTSASSASASPFQALARKQSAKFSPQSSSQAVWGMAGASHQADSPGGAQSRSGLIERVAEISAGTSGPTNTPPPNSSASPFAKLAEQSARRRQMLDQQAQQRDERPQAAPEVQPDPSWADSRIPAGSHYTFEEWQAARQEGRCYVMEIRSGTQGALISLDRPPPARKSYPGMPAPDEAKLPRGTMSPTEAMFLDGALLLGPKAHTTHPGAVCANYTLANAEFQPWVYRVVYSEEALNRQPWLRGSKGSFQYANTQCSADDPGEGATPLPSPRN